MRAGALRHRVAIYAPGVVRTADGGLAETPHHLATVWAEVARQDGREFRSAQATWADVTHVLTLRYGAALSAESYLLLDPDGAAVRLEVLSSVDPEGRRRMLRVIAKQVV